jgi:hypothetical protein
MTRIKFNARGVLLIGALVMALFPPVARSLSKEDQQLIDRMFPVIVGAATETILKTPQLRKFVAEKDDALVVACVRERYTTRDLSESQKRDIAGVSRQQIKVPAWFMQSLGEPIGECVERLNSAGGLSATPGLAQAKTKNKTQAPAAETFSQEQELGVKFFGTSLGDPPFLTCIYPMSVSVPGADPLLLRYIRSLRLKNGHLEPRTGALLGDTVLSITPAKSFTDSGIVKSLKANTEKINLVYDNGKNLSRIFVMATGTVRYNRAYDAIKTVVTTPDGQVIAEQSGRGATEMAGSVVMLNAAQINRLGDALTLSVYADGQLARQYSYTLKEIGGLPRTTAAVSQMARNPKFAYQSSFWDQFRKSRHFNSTPSCAVIALQENDDDGSYIERVLLEPFSDEDEYQNGTLTGTTGGVTINAKWVLKNFPSLF